MPHNSTKASSQKHEHQLKQYDETLKRAIVCKYQYCRPEFKKTIS